MAHWSRRVLLLLLIPAALVLGACAQGTLFGIPNPLYPTVQTADDQFEDTVRFVGVDSVIGSGYVNYHRYMLRSWVNKETLEQSHQLYTTIVYGGDWRFFTSATSQDARELEFTEIDREVSTCSAYGSCTFIETFGADIDEDDLRDNAATGFAVKFRARSGHELIVTLTSEQIAAQLGAIDAFCSQQPEQARA